MTEGDSEALKPGTVVSHFIIDAVLGAGAMGQVWLGTDRRDGTRVAVKVLNIEFSRDPMFRQRFEREAHVATLLKSPYTVQTLAFGREQGHYYIVMEFVEGDSVEKMLSAGPLPVDEALEIATDTARALEAAATQRIVHRDLKPSNIIVSPDGAAKLVDFGIASQGATKDASAGFMGTVQYAAPEQQKGEADERTDIYALGATLFHMLSGRPPFTGRTAEEILNQHARSPFPAALLSLMPEPVVDVVRRCMQKDPHDRYQSAQDLAAALDRLRSRLYQQRSDAPASPPLPDQYRTMVPQPDGSGGATIVVAPRTPARPAPPDTSTDGTVVMGAPQAPRPSPAPQPDIPSAATVVSRPASAPSTPRSDPSPASVTPAAAPLEPAGVPLRPRPQPEAADAKGGGGGGKKVLLMALGGIVVVGAVAGLLLVLSGGSDKEKSSEPSPTVASTSSTGGTSTASSTADASPSGTGSASPSATSTAATPTTVAPTASASASAAPATATSTSAAQQPTATSVPSQPTPTSTTAPPTATPTKAAGNVGSFSVSFQSSSGTVGSGATVVCPSSLSALVGYSGSSAGVSVTTSWRLNGGDAGFSNTPSSTSGASGGIIFPSTTDPGAYSVTIFANGAAVTSGSVTVRCP